MRRLAIAVVFALGCVGCGDKNPVAPVVPDCQLRNTGTLVVTNPTNVSVEVYLDGAYVTTLGSLGGSQTFTIAAGVAHPVEFWWKNSGGYWVGSSAKPIVIQCSSVSLRP